MIFGRKKREQDVAKSQPEQAATEAQDSATGDIGPADEQEPQPDQRPSGVETDPAEQEEAVAEVDYDRAEHGPFDIDEVPEPEGVVDLGSLKVTPHPDLQLRLEVEESSRRVIAVTLDLAGSSLQLQAFAAPRSETLWHDIRAQIAESVTAQGGQSEELDGVFGPELVAKLPAAAAEGSRGYRVARFIGVDGPRWFLRGVLGGDAAVDRDAAAPLEHLFRQVIVERGESPLPPRDLLPLQLPKDAVTGDPAAAQEETFNPGERGPEMTETR